MKYACFKSPTSHRGDTEGYRGSWHQVSDRRARRRR
jgi:hypothetical protein